MPYAAIATVSNRDDEVKYTLVQLYAGAACALEQVRPVSHRHLGVVDLWSTQRTGCLKQMWQIINFDFTRNKFNDTIIKIKLFHIKIL